MNIIPNPINQPIQHTSVGCSIAGRLFGLTACSNVGSSPTLTTKNKKMEGVIYIIIIIMFIVMFIRDLDDRY